MACEKAFVDRVMQRLEMRLLLQSSEQKQLLLQSRVGLPASNNEEVCPAPLPPRLLDPLSEPPVALITNVSREASSPSLRLHGDAKGEGGETEEGGATEEGGEAEEVDAVASNGVCLTLEEVTLTQPAGGKPQASPDGLSRASSVLASQSDGMTGSSSRASGPSTRDVASRIEVISDSSTYSSGVQLPPMPPTAGGCGGNNLSAMELWKLPAENVVEGGSLDVAADHIGQFRWVWSAVLSSH